jgi:hypothetical protein
MTRVDELIRELEEHGVYVRPKEAGRPKTWGPERVMHVWLAVEVQRYMRGRSGRRDVRSTLGALFKSSWYVDVGDKDERTIESAETARRLYYDAKRLMQRDSKLRDCWMRNLALAKRLIDDKVRYEVFSSDTGHVIIRRVVSK